MSRLSRRASAAAAKEAKMKKVAIAGGVLLLGVIGFQAPKVLKSLHGSSGTTTNAAAPAQSAAPPASLTDEAPPAAGQGQLVSFSLFKAKDPFVQQIAVDTNGTGSPSAPVHASPGPGSSGAPPTTSTAAPTPTSTTPTATTAPVPPPTTAPPPPPPASTGPAGASGAATPTMPTTTTPTSTEPAATGAAIATNGVCEVVLVGGAFPSATPFFKLVSIARGGQSAQVGVAEGSLEGGLATVTLTQGKTLTLLNKTTQVRYALELLASCPVPATTASTATAPTTTATATTTTPTAP